MKALAAVGIRSALAKWMGPALLAAAAACSSDPRPAQTGESVQWTTYPDVAPLLADQCATCHSGALPAGGYRVDSYLAAVSRRDDGTPRAAPGDPGALVLMAASGLSGHPGPLPDSQLSQLKDWVVRSRDAKARYTVHLKGWMNPTDPDQFHGLFLRRQAYNTDSCAVCHGSDLRGGLSRVDCNSCHPAGVQACNTCHGDSVSPAPPRDLHGVRTTVSISVGAHRSHVVASGLHAAYRCTACHNPPAIPDHYLNYGHPDEPPSPVVLRGATPSGATWDRTVGTCANSYCHAPSGPADARASNQTPHWTSVGTGEAQCGTCHGLPPASHVNFDIHCEICHQGAYGAGQLLAAKHADGTVELGNGPGGCSNCHGDANSPAPPVDLHGSTDPALPSIGAHRAHLEARHELRGPIPCTECHQVPATLRDPGHIDHPLPATVFPSVPGVAVLASADGALPTYSYGATPTCGSVYCHGNGTHLLTDGTRGLIRNPLWTGGTSQISCGSCHGIPPLNAVHSPGMRLTDCHCCHGDSVTAEGAIIIIRDPLSGRPLSSPHIDGVINVNPNTCP